MCGCSQASSQGLGGGGGHQVPLRFRCVRRRRESLAPFGAHKRPRRDLEGEAGTRYRYASAACAAAGSRWRPSRASCSGARASQRRARRSARAKEAARVGYGGGRRGVGGGWCAHTRHAADPRAGATTAPPKGAPATAGDRWRQACARPRSAKTSRVGATRGTPQHAPSACLGGRATAWAPPVLAGTRPKGVERRARARGQRDRSPNTSPRTARDRLSAPSDCSRWEALI